MRLASSIPLLLLLLAPSAAFAGKDAARGIQDFNATLETIAGVEEPRRSELIAAAYASDLAGIPAGSLSDADLRAFFLATLTSSGLANDASMATTARAAFDALDARSLLVARDYRYMQGLYVGLRDFDDATRFHDRYASVAPLESIPAITTLPGFDPAARSELVPMSATALQRRNLDVGRGAFVLVVADPLCHFTQDAVAAIQADPQLKRYFSGHSKWLAPTGTGLDLAAVRTWNEGLPDYSLSLVDDVHTWPDITTWGTPTFYFFEQGKVAHVVHGWPAEGHAGELKAIIGDAAR